MVRFLHKVQQVIFLDGDDVRRAPIADALFERYINQDPVMRLWGTTVSSAGANNSAIFGLPPDSKALKAMEALGINISYYKSKALTPDDIETASIILTMEQKHANSAVKTICIECPAYKDKIIRFFDYLKASDLAFDSLMGKGLPEYENFAHWMNNLMFRLAYTLKEDTLLPLLARGKGLGSGIVQGRARVIKSVEEANEVEEGDVIVCGTNEIASAFSRVVNAAGGFVTESTSEMSVLSQLAGKLKVPCVGGTYIATKSINDKQEILVDAVTGNVYGYNVDTLI